MADPLLIRSLCLFLPLTSAWLLWLRRRPDRRLAGALLLAFVWNLPALTLLHLAAERVGAWQFGAEGGLLFGFPVDLYLGWAILWGPLPILAAPRASIFIRLFALFVIDLLAMPRLGPIVFLGGSWLIGEGLGLLACALPAQVLADLTRAQRRVGWRACLQVALFTGLMLGLLPAVLLALTGGGWDSLRPPLSLERWLGLQILALPALVGLSAVQEFANRGQGTPVPFDPPTKLVTSGVYAYVANPMQISMTLLLLGWGIYLGSGWVAAAGAMAVIYSVGLARWGEETEMRARFGDAWERYRRGVRPWWPRGRPWDAASELGRPMARLFVAETCVPCSRLGRWVSARQPRALELDAAEDHPSRDLDRITYDPGDGSPEEDGVAAFGRALEHVHLGWAFLGWLIRLPVLRQLIQLFVDALGGGPRRIPRRRRVPGHGDTSS